MKNLSKNSQSQSLVIEKGVRSLQKKIITNHQKIKAAAADKKRQGKRKTTAFDMLLLASYFWIMNDFGDTIIK